MKAKKERKRKPIFSAGGSRAPAVVTIVAATTTGTGEIQGSCPSSYPPVQARHAFPFPSHLNYGGDER